MKVQDALLRAICDQPDEDTPRLAFADWLEENGDADRAAFVRAQVELARMAPDDPGRAGLTELQDAQLRRFGDVWAGDVVGRGVSDRRFRRGFVEEIDATTVALAERGHLWRGRVPLRAARLNAASGRVGRFATCPILRQLTHLRFSDRKFDDTDLAALAASPAFARLTHLKIEGVNDRETRVGQGFGALAGAPFLPGLTSLHLDSGGDLDSAALATLPASGAATGLRELVLRFTAIDDGGALALAAGGCEGLSTLAIESSRIGEEGLVALATSPHLPNLTWLTLAQSRITDAGLSELARAPVGTHLRCLELVGRGAAWARVTADQLAEVRWAHPELDLTVSQYRYSTPRWGAESRFATGEFVDAAGFKRSGSRVSA